MPPSAKPSPEICVVGVGRWGKNHARTLHELGMLGGIVDSDADRLAQRAQQFGVRAFSSIDEAVAAGFDGYIVATPAHTHATVAGFLLERGHHVLVEKPIALFAADARRLRETARRAGVNLMVGHVLLFHPAIRSIRKLIDDGKIGRLQYIYSNRLNLGTVRTEENILWSFAPHDISIFQYLIGDTPIEVESRGGVFLQPGVHDTTLTMLRYPNNIVGHIFLSWLHPYKEHRLVVVGSRGMLSFEDSSEGKPLLFYEKGIDWVQGEPIARDGPTEVIEYEPEMPLTAELSYFARHLDGTPIEIANADSAVEVLEILERATESLRGQTQGAPPVEERPGYFAHASSAVDDGAQVGEGTKIWHYCHVQSGARIGRNCSLGQNVYVASNVLIGDHVRIQNNVSVYEGVELQDYVFCGPSWCSRTYPGPGASIRLARAPTSGRW